MADRNFVYPHDDDREVFGEVLKYTEAKTGFTATLIEKDCYCSLILRCLFQGDSPLVFKGGTCLSKVHVGFYRLSEDLDFVIPARLRSSFHRPACVGPLRRASDGSKRSVRREVPRGGVQKRAGDSGLL